MKLAEYRSKDKEFAKPSLWKIKPEALWNGLFQHKTLSPLANMLMLIPPKTANCKNKSKKKSSSKSCWKNSVFKK